MALNELEYIHGQSSKSIQEPSMDKIRILLEADDIPLGGSDPVREVSSALGQKALTQICVLSRHL